MRIEKIEIKITTRSLFYFSSLCLCAFVVFSLLPNTRAQNSLKLVGPNGENVPVVNEGNQIKLLVMDSNGSPITEGISFESGSPDVAAVDAQGMVKGNRFGFATITARRGSESVSAFVVVARVRGSSGAMIMGQSEKDSSGALYLSDPVNHIIRKKEGAFGAVTVFAGTGVQGSADGERLRDAQFSFPIGVGVDNRAQGGVYIADTLNHKIRRIDFNNQVKTVIGTGSPGITTEDVTPLERVTLKSPQGVAVDVGGNLFVADTENHAIYYVDFVR